MSFLQGLILPLPLLAIPHFQVGITGG